MAKNKDENQYWSSVTGILAGAPMSFRPLSKTPLGWSRYPGSRPPRYSPASDVLVEDSRGTRAKDTLISNIIRYFLPTLWYALYTPYTALIGMTYSSSDLCKYTLGSFLNVFKKYLKILIKVVYFRIVLMKMVKMHLK